MIARPLASLLALAIALLGLWACSSGLGKDPRNRGQDASTGATLNLPIGLDIGVVPTDPAAEPVVAGVVVPAIAGRAARDIALVAFTTAAMSDSADNALGGGNPLSRDPTSDTNGAADVFVAAVSAQDVEKRAFSQSLAGKFRHPRCATCHSMQRSDTQAFVSSAIGFAEPHAGPPPGPTFPNNDPTTCASCHVTSNSFPVPGWQAPAASFDIRSKTVAELAEMARNVPADEDEHFVSDGRVLWALDSGILPTVGGRNGIADDDHDGVVEPEDRDGIPRTVPGGSVNFLRDIDDWRNTATQGVPDSEVVTTVDAVQDITLVSRAAGTSDAGNGESTAPQVVWVPNPGFDAGNPTAAAIGTLFVVFQSTATDLVAGDTNGVMDVFRAAVQLRSAADGTLDLVVQNTTILCSAANGGGNEGNAASGRPAIGGANAEFITFESAATNLIAGFTNNNGAGTDVYVRKVGANGLGTATQLVSHTIGNQATGGNGSSGAPTISSNGGVTVVGFESDASDLINSDLNTVRDVYYADVSGVAPFAKVRASVTETGAEGTGGACRAASVHVNDAGDVRVAFESDKPDLAAAATAATNVFLFDSATGFTTLLNQSIVGDVTSIGNGSARAPVLTPDGTLIAFESDASNIDVLRPDTSTATDVFLVETAPLANGLVLPFRISVTASETASADGPATRPALGTFTNSANFATGLAIYTAAATNLGTCDTTDIMLVFLDEASGVLADFEVSPAIGGPPLDVQFTDTSSGLPTSWEWDFDNDGLVDSTEQNPLRTFTAVGFYTVRLVATNARTSGTKTVANAFRVLGPCVADFTVSDPTVAPLVAITFTDTSTEEPDTWEWDFGDGSTSTLQNPTHAYASVGTYTVSLTATGPGGSGSVTKTDFITIAFPPPNVTVIANPTSGDAPLFVSFSFSNSGGPVSSVSWNFDDPGSGGANTSTSFTPSHTFNSVGLFTVQLTATGPGGVDGDTQNIDVDPPPPNITIVASQTSGTAPFTVNFTVNNSGGPISSYSWNFDDPPSGGANTSTSSAPSHTFSNPDFCTVSLTVSGPGGGDSDTQGITVNAPTWTQVYGSITGAGCTACHTTPLAGGAPFSMINQGTAYANLVNVASTTGSCAAPRVDPFDAPGSTLRARVQGSSCGLQMTGLTGAQITALIIWINAGAANN